MPALTLEVKQLLDKDPPLQLLARTPHMVELVYVSVSMDATN
jgi:hypothetical protein